MERHLESSVGVQSPDLDAGEVTKAPGVRIVVAPADLADG